MDKNSTSMAVSEGEITSLISEGKTNINIRKEILKIVEKAVRRNGLRMSKKISSGGLFSDSTYDNRVVYTLDELFKLTRQGFLLEDNAGLFIFNALIVDN